MWLIRIYSMKSTVTIIFFWISTNFFLAIIIWLRNFTFLELSLFTKLYSDSLLHCYYNHKRVKYILKVKDNRLSQTLNKFTLNILFTLWSLTATSYTYIILNVKKKNSLKIRKNKRVSLSVLDVIHNLLISNTSTKRSRVCDVHTIEAKCI